MSLENNWQTEKRSSFSTAVKVLTFIFGVGVVVAAVCVYALFSGCGGGSGNAPVYDENGVCVKNCSPEECPPCGYIDNAGNCVTDNCVNNGDGWVAAADNYNPSSDSCNGDTCSTQPQYDTTTGACEAIKAGKKPPEVCTPKKYKDPYCWCPDAPECQGFPSGCNWEEDDNPKPKPCTTDAECQVVPCTAWPPEVCWGLPCMLVGKWDCPSSVWDYTDAEFYDNGDGYCRIHTKSGGDIYYKPGDDHLQRPPSGPFEDKYTIIDGGSQLFNEGSDGFTFTCTKVVEEE